MAYINKCCYLLCSILILILGYCAPNALSRSLGGNKDTLSMRDKHEQWMATYDRTYQDLAEKEKRFNIFKKNVEHIESFNRLAPLKSILYTLAVNEFADLRDEEFTATYSSSNLVSPLYGGATTSNFKYANVTNVPSSLDWREKGAVTPIKNQLSCGCCWAFAAVAAVEGLNQINTGNLVSLSEQQLLDCDHSNKGCGGGISETAFTFISKSNGITTNQIYPYKGIQGQCQTVDGPLVTIKGYEQVPAGNETALLQAVSKQPVAVRVRNKSIKHYKGGIFHGPCETPPNHKVVIVGYGTENGTDYWLVKNSFGEQWGENGYIRLIRGQNICDLTSAATYPI